MFLLKVFILKTFFISSHFFCIIFSRINCRWKVYFKYSIPLIFELVKDTNCHLLFFSCYERDAWRQDQGRLPWYVEGPCPRVGVKSQNCNFRIFWSLPLLQNARSGRQVHGRIQYQRYVLLHQFLLIGFSSILITLHFCFSCLFWLVPS